jgi:outer membrane protein OmpA-like peptidoglycan-associated protein/tetratricopeptide (TPR) repeat protein
MVTPIRVCTFPSFSLYAIRWLIIFLLGFSCIALKAADQKNNKILIKAKDAISSGNFLNAELLVKKAVRIDSNNVMAYLLLSDISDELSKPEQQAFALEKVIRIDPVNFPLAYKLLAGLYFSKGAYSEALKYYKHYESFNLSSDSAFVNMRALSSAFAIESISKNSKVTILSPGENINSSLQEYWPVIATNDSVLYFTRLISNEKNFVYERIFMSQRNIDGWGQAEQLSFSDNENVNIGTMCISADGKLLFYTACGQKDGYGSCDIFYARKNNNSWSKPANAGPVVNTNNWEAQPSVSSDNRYLYFASSRLGGYGGMDIWQCKMKEMKNGSLFFSNPHNLGKSINTKENDFSPFIHADGSTLYFSSEGKSGFGGSDMFISRLGDTVWSEAVNLGFPLNSRLNDDGLVVSPTAKIAFFSSNREGTVERSKDLFHVELPEEFLPQKVGYITGRVYDIETGHCIEAIIEITTIDNGKGKTVTSDISSGYITTLNAGRQYALHVDKDGYLFYSRHFNLKEVSTFTQAERFDIFLEPVKPGKKFVLPNVFFDFDSDILKPESNDELQKLTDFLRNNQRLKVEISGHTDNVGSNVYNQELSEKRAKAILNYLITFIDPSRLTYKGYGPNVPVSTNDTEEGRALNRRSEVKILTD